MQVSIQNIHQICHYIIHMHMYTKLHIRPLPFITNLKNLTGNSHSRDKYLWQFHLNPSIKYGDIESCETDRKTECLRGGECIQ